MTVAELLQRIIAAYPGATAESMATFKSVFFARLRPHEGDVLDAAANEVLGSFKPTMRQPFPIPADFEKHLPAGHPKVSGGGKPIDLKAHRERKQRLMADWRAGQGARAANGVPEVLRALEFVAEQIAGLMAWDDSPNQLLLKRGEVRIAQHRAISQQRRVEHGPPPSDADLWWEQISGIAARWGIETTREEWTAKEGTMPPAPIAAPQGERKPHQAADTPTNRRLAELAAAKREGLPAAENFDIPEVSHG